MLLWMPSSSRGVASSRPPLSGNGSLSLLHLDEDEKAAKIQRANQQSKYKHIVLFWSSRPCSSWPLLLSFRLQIHDGYVLVKLLKTQYNSRRRNATCCSLLPPCCHLRYRPNPSIDSPSPMVLLPPKRSLSPRTPVM